MYCGEPAHKQKMIKSNTSIFQELAGIGIYLKTNDSAVSHTTRRAMTKQLLTRTIFSNNTGGLDVYDALANSRYAHSRDNSTSAQDKPVHDEFADLRAAVENFAVNVVYNVNYRVKEIKYK
jgi:hypothetical protein